jgi:CrcB protein
LTWLLVGAGGALGAMARHGLNAIVHRLAGFGVFPAGIFVINVTGSAVIGVLAGLIASGRLHVTAEWRLFLVVGVLGGFTTFSSFSLDTLTLIRSGHLGQAAWNVAGQVGLSLLAVIVGYRLSAGAP